MDPANGICTCRLEPAPDWLDYNGHLRDASYALAFSQAVDALMIELGMDEAYRAGGGTLYTLQNHLFYLDEISAAAPLRVETRVIDADHRLLHLWQGLYRDRGDTLAAACESLSLHVARTGEGARAAPFPAAMATRIEALRNAAPAPPRAQRAAAIAIRR